MTDLEVIQDSLTLSEDDALVVLDLCDWVEHEVAIARHGYPRDNVIGRPMAERLADPAYVQRLAQLASEEEEVEDNVVAALNNRLQVLADSGDGH